MKRDIRMLASWRRSAQAILAHRLRKVLVIGALDRGKSTYCEFLAAGLNASGIELYQDRLRRCRHADCMAGHAYIGTSGWNYDFWREPFYEGRPAKEWLRYCAARFSAIEVNATFYRLQSVETFRRWRDETPADFRFAIKAHRYLTHNKKLSDPLPAIRLERERASGLGVKLAAVVWQLPHNLHRNVERLEGFARALRSWRRVRHAIEFRHVTWFDEEVAACLRRHRIAVCQSDAADWPLWDAVTTDLVYVRLHGHELTYASCYSEAALRAWADKVCRWMSELRDVHVYFDNDAYGDAPWNALRLIELVRDTSRRRARAPLNLARRSARESLSRRAS